MNVARQIANYLIQIPSNRILDRVITNILSGYQLPVVVRTRYHYSIYVGGEDELVRGLRITVALGLYERNLFRVLATLVETGSIVIDVGANEGYVSLHLSTLVGPKGHVFAFEPHPRNVACIKDNIHLNAVKNITVIGKALSDTLGVATLHDDRAWGTLIDGIYPSSSSISVEMETLDTYYQTEPRLAHLRAIKPGLSDSGGICL